MADFYLVQRLTRRDLSSKTGFDSVFGCQYMGSAEFEWGALPDSLKRIRAARRVVIHEGQVTRNGVTVSVYVVGDRKKVKAIPDLLTDWVKDEYPRSKESSYFPEHIVGTASKYQDVDAWWALDQDVMWALGRGTAEDLLRAVTK